MVNLNAGPLKALDLPRIYQLGMVVRDMDQAIAFYTDFMGIAPWYRGAVAETEMVYQGEKVSAEVDMVFGYSGKLMIELIAVAEGTRNIYSDFLEAHGEGLHHLGIEVSNYDRLMRRVGQMDIPILQWGYVRSKGGAMSRMAYLDTTTWCGYPIEIMETRLFGYPVGKSELMMKVGCLLGDAQKVAPPENP